MKLKMRKELSGSILDIGGGGEGIIGRLYGESVTAIDNSQTELDEAPNCCKKLLMDAVCLDFANGTFENVTFFYSLMFMTRSEQMKAIAEAARAVKTGGQIHIWDASFKSA